MKHTKYLAAVLCLLITCGAQAQNGKDWAQLNFYAAENDSVSRLPASQKRVVFMGNSIIELWHTMHPYFFSDHGFICRGISGQTSYQYLVRFYDDVIKLKPEYVILHTPANDIAENTYPYNEDITFHNMTVLAEMAKAHKIKVIISSTLPTARFAWSPNIKNVADKVTSLNTRMRAYAKANKIPYVDYYTPLVYGKERAFNPAYTVDGVHPTTYGYDVLESIILKFLKDYL